MGKGTYYFSDTKNFATSDYHDGDSASDISYDDLCAKVVAEAKSVLLENPGAINKLDANLQDADIEDCVDADWLRGLDEPMFGDSPLSSVEGLEAVYYGEDNFYSDNQQDRQTAFEECMREGLQALPEMDVYVSQPEDAKHGDFQLIANGVFSAVGIKHWESEIYVGVIPKPEILNYEHAIMGETFDPATGKDKGLLDFAAMQKLFARAALSIEQPSKFEQGGYDRKPDLQRIAGMPDSGGITQDDLFGPRLAPYQCFPEGAGEALVARAEEAIESGEEDAFERRFGVSASDVYTCRETLEVLGEVMAETGHLPQAIEDGYKAEFDKLDVVVKAALHEVAPDAVYARASGWHSKPVDVPSQEELIAARGAPAVSPGRAVQIEQDSSLSR